jgi:hypothetical protein
MVEGTLTLLTLVRRSGILRISPVRSSQLDEAAGRGRREREERKETAPAEVKQPGSGGVKDNVRDEWAESQERR